MKPMLPRFLYPSFFTNEKIASLPPLERLFFQGLWLCADREGRLECRPDRLKALILPYDNLDPGAALGDLDLCRLIKIYQVNKTNYIQILGWSDHGKPFTHEKPSNIPPFEPSANLDPTLPQPWDKVKDKRLEIKDQRLEIKEKRSKKKEIEYTESFSAFWKAYPRKVGKPKAEKAFTQLNLMDKVDLLVAAIEKQKHSLQWTKDGGQFIPYPTTWLNREGWNDDLGPRDEPDPSEERKRRIMRAIGGSDDAK